MDTKEQERIFGFDGHIHRRCGKWMPENSICTFCETLLNDRFVYSRMWGEHKFQREHRARMKR